MWYKIPFTYKDFSTGCAIDQDADLLLDLPQVWLKDAKENLFVKDLVRHPIIKDCYRINEKYKQCPESILQPCNQNINTNTLYKVPVRYQRNPLIANWGHSFFFYIFIDSIGPASPFMPREFSFTCRAEYDYYYDAFNNDLIVNTGVWGPEEFEDGAIVKVFTGNSFDLAKVYHNNDGRVFAKIIAPSSGEVEINHLTISCIRSVDLDPDVLSFLSARCEGGQIEGYYRRWYEITLNDPSATVVRFARTRYAGWFCLIVEDANNRAYYRFSTIQFIGLDGLQKAIKQQYGIPYCPSQSVLDSLSSYHKDVYPRQRFVVELSKIIEPFGLDADYATVLKVVRKKLNIPSEEAEFYLSGFKQRGYFAE